MDYVADLHLHSRYSRAVSQEMNLPTIARYARKKGLEILATGDWTHPLWFREIHSQLEETKKGLYTLKSQSPDDKPIYFFLSVEISCIYSQGGKARRIHNLVFVPNFDAAEKINKELIKRGANLSSDGRPIIGLSSKNLLSLIMEIDENSLLIPAHIWTPWFGVFGANSGFDSLEECFENSAQYIYGIETGLSSDPEMNWEINELNTRSILSFSDAHSPAKMGREVTTFRLNDISYDAIREAIMVPSQRSVSSENRVLYTVEFYPEEGKYHYNGHRNCDIYQTPEETKEKGEICPVCKRRITVGVMQRVMDLADETVHGIIQSNQQGLTWIKDPKAKHPPFVKLVPLNEIIAESLKSTVSSMKVKTTFDNICETFGSEMEVLLKTPIAEIEKKAGERIAEGVAKVRGGNIFIQPGYDNVYGTVKIWSEEKKESLSASGQEKEKQDGEDPLKEQLGIDF